MSIDERPARGSYYSLHSWIKQANVDAYVDRFKIFIHILWLSVRGQMWKRTGPLFDRIQFECIKLHERGLGVVLIRNHWKQSIRSPRLFYSNYSVVTRNETYRIRYLLNLPVHHDHVPLVIIEPDSGWLYMEI